MREMKYSGVEWIGNIPEEWDVTKLLNILRSSISDGPHETPELVSENGIPFISVDSLNSTKSIDFSVVRKYISKEAYLEYSKKTKLEKGDILFSKSATIGKTAIVNNEKFMIWSPLAIIKVNIENVVDYIYYLLNCEELIKFVSLMGSHNTQFNVGMRTLERVPIPIPTIAEQQAIADILDRKCTQIDALIANEEQQIAKLKAYKQSVITETVTKGLNPDVPMKDSGVEWIGEIPEQWKVVRIKNICNFNPSSSKTYSENDIVSYAPMECVRTGQLLHKEIQIKNISSGLTYFEENDIIMAKVTPCFENGNIAIATNLTNGIAFGSSELFVFRAKSEIRHFLFYFLQNDIFKNYAAATMTGTGGLKRVSPSFVNNFYLALPSINERQQIADYLDQKCEQIDRLIAIKQQKIEKIQQYKKSVIYEYVTGKREVST